MTEGPPVLPDISARSGGLCHARAVGAGLQGPPSPGLQLLWLQFPANAGAAAELGRKLAIKR